MLLSVNFSTGVPYPWYIEPLLTMVCRTPHLCYFDILPMEYQTPPQIQLTSLVVMDTDYISRCKSTLAAQVNGRLFAIMTDIIFKKKYIYILRHTFPKCFDINRQIM